MLPINLTRSVWPKRTVFSYLIFVHLDEQPFYLKTVDKAWMINLGDSWKPPVSASSPCAETLGVSGSESDSALSCRTVTRRRTVIRGWVVGIRFAASWSRAVHWHVELYRSTSYFLRRRIGSFYCTVGSIVTLNRASLYCRGCLAPIVPRMFGTTRVKFV